MLFVPSILLVLAKKLYVDICEKIDALDRKLYTYVGSNVGSFLLHSHYALGRLSEFFCSPWLFPGPRKFFKI